MVQFLSSQPKAAISLQPQRRIAQAIVMGGAGIGVVILIGALMLWFHYGTTVFFETIASGISACF